MQPQALEEIGPCAVGRVDAAPGGDGPQRRQHHLHLRQRMCAAQQAQLRLRSTTSRKCFRSENKERSAHKRVTAAQQRAGVYTEARLQPSASNVLLWWVPLCGLPKYASAQALTLAESMGITDRRYKVTTGLRRMPQECGKYHAELQQH